MPLKICIIWTPYQAVKTEQRYAYITDPDQALSKKKSKAIYNAVRSLPPDPTCKLNVSSTDVYFVFCYLPWKGEPNTLFAHFVLSLLLI